jgi:osmotically-inducible protein OsmY
MAHADSEAALMNRVNGSLRSNPRLNGAKAYTAAEGVVVLYGTIFDDKDRALAEQIANSVSGVTQVVDNLRTKTGKWADEEERINTQLLTNGFTDVQAKVVGPYIYLSGQVTGQANKDRAVSVAASVYPNKQINNMIFVQPGSMF